MVGAIIQDLSFTLEGQKRLFVQGEIGSGKTTLLLALLGFVPVTKGEIKLFGKVCREEKDFAPFRGTIGICFQNAMINFLAQQCWMILPSGH
ncbi:cobalt transport protein CbiM [Haemophilus influenzae]|uniref:Cobalt transport protein CbiM n=1 Tax=Haemophilus influenzae TaxID=727 RepID=A0A2X1Q1V8_HAEIF|nr:cobalt transport protein CbiM [Haemophilus influenzae]